MAAPPSTDPFELIIWEQVGYLTDDDQRAETFALLRSRVGLQPEQILAAPESTLREITRAGGAIAAPARAQRLRDSAQRVMAVWGGDLRRVLREPLPQARKALTRFGGIGEPGAEKILLFSRAQAILALESNGVRVLTRMGFAREQKSYRATYRGLQDVLQAEIKPDIDWLIEAHQLLRRHGQETCRRSTPRCEACPVAHGCAYFASHSK